VINVTVRRRTYTWWTVVFVMLVILGGCRLASSEATPMASFCNGISAEVGGCGPTPSFAGTTCDTLATEFGSQVDRAMLDVINGPASVADEGRSIRILHRGIVITTALTDRMIALGILQTCTMPAFLDRAATAFGADMKARIGGVLNDGSPPATYEEFLERLGRIMSGIGKPP
jgi:hypothetical protein